MVYVLSGLTHLARPEFFGWTMIGDGSPVLVNTVEPPGGLLIRQSDLGRACMPWWAWVAYDIEGPSPQTFCSRFCYSLPFLLTIAMTPTMGSQPSIDGFESTISTHKPEKELPNGWKIMKFGGTSVGKFAPTIAEDIVKYALLRPVNFEIRIAC